MTEKGKTTILAGTAYGGSAASGENHRNTDNQGSSKPGSGNQSSGNQSSGKPNGGKPGSGKRGIGEPGSGKPNGGKPRDGKRADGQSAAGRGRADSGQRGGGSRGGPSVRHGEAAAKTATARSVALEVLTRVDEQNAYSNLLLNRTLQKSGLSRQDAALATELVYGTIQRLNTIDHYLARFVKGGLAKLQPWVRSLLRIGCYQLMYLDRVPDHAVVSEAVNIAKRRGHAGIAGLINGTLRTMIRERAGLAVPDGLPPVESLALRQSHPAWLVARWIERFGLETAERICAANNAAPHASVRANALRVSREELLRELQQQGVDAAPSELAPQGLVLRSGGSAASLPQFAAGLLSIQDESSMLVAELLGPRPGMTVLDCCAAPGGKTTHIAEKMRDDGVVWASDVHEHKRGLVDEQAERLKLRSVRTLTADARELANRFPPASFDRILLDAPCTGFGVIRRKPDLKWAKQPDDIAAINAIQRDILERIHTLLKPGGILVYSTCTLEREENEDTIQWFLRNHPEFSLDTGIDMKLPDALMPFTGMLTILPYQFGSDGFFIARLRKR